MNDTFGTALNIGDSVAVVKRNILIPAEIVDFTSKQIRVIFDIAKYPWAIGYGYKYGANKGKTPTFLVNPEQIVKKPVDATTNSASISA